jgi:surface polysaccharide O-acyltransferase-like enzyme
MISADIQSCSKKGAKGRVFYLDVLRAIACIMVVLIHLSGEMSKNDTFSYWTGNVVNSLARGGVPLFVMISGALMLNEQYEFTRAKWLSHLKKFALIFAVWSCAYAAFYAKDIIFAPENFLLRLVF